MVDTIYGLAVDQKKTLRSHQIVSFSESKDTGHKSIHYSVIRPSGTLANQRQFIDNLQDVIFNKHCFCEASRFYKANTLFSKFVADIKTDKRSYFTKDVLCPAVTFDLNFDRDLEMNSIEFRLTNAVMTEDIKFQQAYHNLRSCKPDSNLKMWHDLIMVYKHQTPIQRKLLFEDITSTTTNIINRYMCQYAVKNKLGGVFKVPPKLDRNGKYPKIYDSIYGSTFDFEKQIQETRSDKSKAILPITAMREPIDALNLLSLVEYKRSGENIVSPDLLNAVISYKTMKSKSRLICA